MKEGIRQRRKIKRRTRIRQKR